MRLIDKNAGGGSGGGGGGGSGGGGDVNLCKYKEYGYSSAKKHKINRSQHCDFNDILHSSIVTY